MIVSYNSKSWSSNFIAFNQVIGIEVNTDNVYS